MKKILVLDDNQDILGVVTDILEYENFSVQGISTAAALSPATQTFKPDLVLLDLRLADGHGGELCRELKAHPSSHKTPVIIFTSYNQPNTNLYDYGCDAVIAKPFDLTELVDTINGLIPAC